MANQKITEFTEKPSPAATDVIAGATADGLSNIKIPASAFATGAEGDLATTALQPGDINTLAELNALVSDATLIDTTDARLSDARTPLAHTHTQSDITGLSGTNSGDQNVFQTIAVAGQTNVVADTTTDTLTLEASGGIGITTNSTTDTITILSPTFTMGTVDPITTDYIPNSIFVNTNTGKVLMFVPDN